MLPLASLQFAFDKRRERFHTAALKFDTTDFGQGATFLSIKFWDRAGRLLAIGTNTDFRRAANLVACGTANQMQSVTRSFAVVHVRRSFAFYDESGNVIEHEHKGDLPHRCSLLCV